MTNVDGSIKREAIAKLCDEVAEVREKYSDIIFLVSSGAIGVGLPMLGYTSGRPDDSRILQAASAIGQPKLMAIYGEELARHNLVYGQLLLAPDDFLFDLVIFTLDQPLSLFWKLGSSQLLMRMTLLQMMLLGGGTMIALPLLAHLVQAEKLIILTDTEGIFSADPHLDKSATLIPEIDSTAELTADVNWGGKQGSGGMSSKLAAARMAAWSGVTTTIASAER